MWQNDNSWKTVKSANYIDRAMISTERLIVLSVFFWVGGATALYGVLELTLPRIKVEPDIAPGYRIEALHSMGEDEQWTTSQPTTTHSKKCAHRRKLRSSRGCWSIRNLPALAVGQGL